MKKTTRAMVAERAGVSLPMVSYVINNSRPVSPKTRQKILQAIDELNYTPDVAAQSMVTKRSKCFTIISNHMTNPMYGEIILEFEKAAFSAGYSTNICGGELELRQYMPTLVARRIDGLYFSSIPSKVTQADINFLIENGVVICCGNYLLPNETRVNRLDVDYEQGMKKALAYLKKTGHKKVIYANGFSKGYPLDIRYESYQKYAAEFGFETGNTVFYGKGPQEMNNPEGYELGKQIIASGIEFDACVCTSDMFAYGVMQAFKEGGISIPDDVSVISFENLLFSDLITPKLTSVSFDRVEFANVLLQQLIESVRFGTVTKKMISMEVFVRDSVKDRTV